MENINEENLLDKQFVFSKKVSIVDKYNFYEYIAVMLDGGVGVSEALESVHQKVHSVYFKQKINELITYVSSGDSFSKSMKKIPQIFEKSEISMIEAGESTGMLSQSLLRLSDDLKKLHELSNKVKGALTYPLIIFLFLLLAISVVLVYVIPSIKPLFDTAEAELPGATVALIAVSDFLVNNFLLLGLLIVTSIVLFFGYKNTDSGKENIEHFIFSVPLIGKVYRNYILARIASNLGTLNGAGVNFVKTLTLTGKATNSFIYGRLFDMIISKVSKGESMVSSMHSVDEAGDYFPASFLQMLSVGEKTASIESVSEKLSKQYEREVDYSLANLTKWIEPIAIAIAGVFVLWFAFAIFGAILKITEVVG